MLRRRRVSSRLSRTSEKQNKRQALFFTIGIIAIILVLIQFGPILVNIFGNVVYTLRGGDEREKPITGNQLIQPPSLVGVPTATQSAFITFGGLAPDSNGRVEIYLNDELEEEIDIEDSLDFSVRKIQLEKGSNSIKARFVKGDKASSFSEEYFISYITEKPKLEVDTPTEGANFTKADKNITVSGTTDPDNTVTVNSFRAIVDSAGKFTYQLSLNDGENNLKIEAQNSAGSKTEKSIKVTYTP